MTTDVAAVGAGCVGDFTAVWVFVWVGEVLVGCHGVGVGVCVHGTWAWFVFRFVRISV